MAINQNVFAADTARVIADLPAAFVWRGQTIPCAASDLGDGTELGEFGISTVPSVQFVFLLASVAGDLKPASNDTVKYNGRDLRIAATVVSPCGTTATITAVNKNK